MASRFFLFEIIDLKGDGFIDVDEVRHFYNGLLKMHKTFDMNPENPFALFDEFYISWFDQISPVDDCLDKKWGLFDGYKFYFDFQALVRTL